MSVERDRLARRLKLVRENAGLTQEQVAAELGVSRGLIGQFETAAKMPSSLQLTRLAKLYGRDVGDFFRVEAELGQAEAFAALFRAALASEPARAKAISETENLCREYASLEEVLGVSKDRLYPAEYEVPSPRSRWEAVRQGERLAEAERSRLKLGDSPIQDVATVLELQGLRAVEVALPEDVSGIFLNAQRDWLFIIVNSAHNFHRRAFSYGHEYCHALVDRDRSALVSRAENREELSEIRANAFAAAFLLPESGVRAFVQALGKGEQSRSVVQAFDEIQAVEGQKRFNAGSQDIEFYDVAHLAHHFSVSYDSALYRLLNLKLISNEEHEHLTRQKQTANLFRKYLGPEPNRLPKRPGFRHKLLLLALEAFRREVISRDKLRQICLLAEVPRESINELISAVAGDNDRKERSPDGTQSS
jgi:Zn-dependent peptidase ImmA (M78 family)/DNA-binding XRE family transcriptional regulator